MPGTRQRLAPEARRRHLVETALGVFAGRRYAETELEDVATAAGVQRPLIYHYFPGGKSDLYAAVVAHAWGLLVAQLAVTGAANEEDPLPRNLRSYLDLVETDDPAMLVVLGARRNETPEVQEIVHGAGTALAAGMAHNQLGDDAPTELVLSGLRGFIGFFDVVLDDWRAGRIERAEVEALIAESLPALAAAAQRAAARS